MAELITRTGGEYFRWHDSGDLQSLGHLERIVAVCDRTPTVRHWLPTREYRIVTAYLREHGSFPANLNVRLSAHMVNRDAPYIDGTTGSIVVDGPARGHECPAPTTGNQCGDCRACWDKGVETVAYHRH
jgi:hypothetical protein